MAEFSKLFRISKLASYEPNIKQVYTSKLKNRSKGDWGLKRDIPTGWRSPLITIQALDCYERQTLIESGLNDYLILKRFKEIFGNTIEYDDDQEGKFINIQKLNNKEFKNKILEAKNCSKDWKNKNLINKNDIIDIEKALNFLKLTDNTFSSENIKPPPILKVDRFPKIAVKGRILNRNGNGFSVGVNGIVCFLEIKQGFKNFRRSALNLIPYKLQTFYVENVSFNEEDIPNIRLSLNPTNPVIKSKNYSLFKSKENSNNIENNIEHLEIQKLFETNKKENKDKVDLRSLFETFTSDKK